MHLSQFSEEKFSKFRKFSQNFQQIVFFIQTRKKLTNGLLNSFEKYAKIIHFSQFSKKIFLKFRNFLKISNKFSLSSKRAKN